MFDKRYQVSVTFFTVKNFPNSVDAAMPNNVYIVTYINTNLPAGTEQTALNVIAWVRSQVYRHSHLLAGMYGRIN